MRKIFDLSSVHHGQGVSCAVLGPRTGNILATGGRDKEICLWTVNDKSLVHTLTGFVSGNVECVLFSWSELEIAGGNTSGAVKIWDIRRGQTVCSFAGHRGKVKCLAQSQFEDNFWASGAFDGHVKLWDSRSCQLVATYRSHSNKTVTAMEFSPDGRWVVTGGEDCLIKLWDITAGKPLAELQGHSGSLSAVQFHPNEYLLASSSQDKTVRFWDMETFECVSQSAPDSGPIKCVLFDPSGRCLYSASIGGGLRVLGWEPARLFDSESCPSQWIQQWQGVTTLAMAGQNLVAACYSDGDQSDSTVTVFGIDATRLRPIYAAGDCQNVVSNNNDLVTNNPMRRSFHRPNCDSTETNGDAVGDHGDDVEDTNQNNDQKNATIVLDEQSLAFSARPKLARSPPNTPVPSDPTTAATPFSTPHVSSDPNLGSTFTVVAAVAPQRLANPSTGSLGRLPSPARGAASTKSTSSAPSSQLQKAKNTATVTPLKPANPPSGPNTGGRKVVHEVPPQIRSSKTSIPMAKSSGRLREVTIKETPTSNDIANRRVDEEEEEDEGIETSCGEDATPNNLGRTYTLSPEDFIPVCLRMLRGYWSYLQEFVSEKGIEVDGIFIPPPPPPYNGNRYGGGKGRGSSSSSYSPHIDRRLFNNVPVVSSGQPSQRLPGVLHHRRVSPAARKQQRQSNVCRATTGIPEQQHCRENGTGTFRKEQSSSSLSATFTLFHESALPSSSTHGPPLSRNLPFPSQSMTVVSEDDCLVAVEKACRSMSVVLDHRQRTLSMCRTAWRNRGPIAAVELACQMNDPSVVVDLLNILNFRSNMWKLDLCVAILPQLRELLESKYDTYVHTAVNSLRLVLRGFGQIIKNGLQAGKQVPSIGVDISLEERISKCQKCYNELLAIRESVQRKNKLKADKRGGRNAHSYRELSLLMNSLDV